MGVFRSSNIVVGYVQGKDLIRCPISLALTKKNSMTVSGRPLIKLMSVIFRIVIDQIMIFCQLESYILYVSYVLSAVD